jgi:Cdc6-like AAA superfamily ATPase
MEQWLPIGFELEEGLLTKKVLQQGLNWQITSASDAGRVLFVTPNLYDKWVSLSIIDKDEFRSINFGDEIFRYYHSKPEYTLTSIDNIGVSRAKSDAISFAYALKKTRECNSEIPFQDSIYLESISRLLPTFSISTPVEDDVILGYWLTGGIPISCKKFRKLNQSVTYLKSSDVQEIIEAAGLTAKELAGTDKFNKSEDALSITEDTVNYGGEVQAGEFMLKGRDGLSHFFNEHVIDIVRNEARYKAMGIGFPAAIILYGPPGSGKTYAVERLTDYLGWPIFSVDASSIGSKYIHETSQKIAEIFKRAINSSPSVLVIDEMDAFLTDREADSGQHRVEEVAEFLRQIPEATKNKVLVIGMTNRIDMIDPAILRRGRFDHVIKVDYASDQEIFEMMSSELAKVPTEETLDLHLISKDLTGRPLSDAAFVVRESARLAARNGQNKISQDNLNAALQSTGARNASEEKHMRIGFI